VEAFERLMEDAEADRPFIATLTISRARRDLPAPGFLRLRPTSGASSYSPLLLLKS
jgi:hypothetical protein